MLEQTEDLATTWLEKFDQKWSESKIANLIGHSVDIVREGSVDDADDGAEEVTSTFVVQVAGFSKSVLHYIDSESEKEKKVVWWSLITLHGQAIPLQNDMTVTKHEPEPGITETDRLQDDPT